MAAKSPLVAKRQAEIWKSQGHEVDVDSYPHKYIDKTTDTTLWFDCSPNPKCAAARATDYDAFFTEGGLQRTGNTSAIQDPKGFGIDNDWKFNQGVKEFERTRNWGPISASRRLEDNREERRQGGGRRWPQGPGESLLPADGRAAQL